MLGYDDYSTLSRVFEEALGGTCGKVLPPYIATLSERGERAKLLDLLHKRVCCKITEKPLLLAQHAPKTILL
jgi:hypothetical protein